jgi:hypothetical protein
MIEDPIMGQTRPNLMASSFEALAERILRERWCVATAACSSPSSQGHYHSAREAVLGTGMEKE